MFKNYLTNRTQIVTTSGYQSQPITVTSGVPQGGVLSPALFCIFVRDINLINAEIIKFADDTTAITIHKNTNDIDEEIQNTVNEFEEQCVSHGLRLNASKTQHLCITKSRNINIGNYAEEIKILGITFNKKMNWSSHISKIIRICSNRIYPIRKLRPILNKKCLHKMYEQNIRSVIEYAAPVFVGLNADNSNSLENLQKRVLKIIYFPNNPPSTVSLNVRRNTLAKNLYLKAHLSRTHSLHHLIPVRMPRTSKFRQPPARTTRRLRSFIPFTTDLVNSGT